MKIVSINRARLQQINFNGERHDTGIFKEPVSGPVQIHSLGIAGDTIADRSVHGGTDQAIYLYSVEDYQWWSSQLQRPLDWGLFGENLTTDGLDLRRLVIGDRLEIGDVTLEISAPRTPCFKLAVRMGDSGFAKAFVNAARPGAYARVLTEGTINPGDAISFHTTEEDFAGVVEVFQLWHSKERSPEQIARALRSPLAAHHHETIASWA